MRKSLTVAMATLMLTTSVFTAPAYADRRREQAPPQHSYWENRRDPPPGHEFRPHDDRDDQRWEDRNRPPPNWNRESWSLRQRYLRNHGHDEHDDDATIGLVVGALLGFALGAAVVDSQQQQANATSRLNDPGWIAYCARRYRSFDPYTGTFLGTDGLRHYCR